MHLNIPIIFLSGREKNSRNLPFVTILITVFPGRYHQKKCVTVLVHVYYRFCSVAGCSNKKYFRGKLHDLDLSHDVCTFSFVCDVRVDGK